MDFYTVLDQVIELLRSRGRVTYRALKRQFNLDDEFLEDLKEVIQRFESYIAQYLGDGLPVYFGYPQAHEDDAQRGADRIGDGRGYQGIEYPSGAGTRDSTCYTRRDSYRAGRGRGDRCRRETGAVGPRGNAEHRSPHPRIGYTQYGGHECSNVSPRARLFCH